MTDYKCDHEFYARKQYKNEVFHSLGGTGTRVPSHRYHLLKSTLILKGIRDGQYL